MDLLDILRYAQNALKPAIKSRCVHSDGKSTTYPQNAAQAFLTALRAISTSSTG